MRTIEEKIVNALNGNNGVKKLSCRDSVEVDGNIKKYYLWDNLLFWNDTENIYYFSARGWSSSTTKSRLNTLLQSSDAVIHQKNYKWFLDWNGRKYPVDSEGIFCFKGGKLYRKAARDVEVLPESSDAVIHQKNWFLDWNGKKYPVDSENNYCFKGSKFYKKAARDVEVLPL